MIDRGCGGEYSKNVYGEAWSGNLGTWNTGRHRGQGRSLTDAARGDGASPETFYPCRHWRDGNRLTGKERRDGRGDAGPHLRATRVVRRRKGQRLLQLPGLPDRAG